jgi:hypothetical protein
MPQPECRLVWYAAGEHPTQLYTGFLTLHRSGLIRLSQTVSKKPFPSSTPQHLKDIGGSQLSLVLDGNLVIHYDCHDAVELNEERLEDCDFYFKRSYSQAYVDALAKHKSKVFPLGLTYRVLPDKPDWRSVHRAFLAGRGLAGKMHALLDALDAGNWLKYNPRVREFEALPEPDLPPKVLFLVTAYDPYDSPGRSKQKIEQMVGINDTRAKCIRILRRELGPRFFGGFNHNPYTIKAYREFLVQDNEVTRKRNYIRLLKSFPICIATTGLHGSIGWKFAEYVALAKAVVSERLNYQVPGDLQAGRNYLEFASPEQCAEQAVRLMEDREQRARLMFNNAVYYRSYQRPDSLVLNSLLKVLSMSHALPSRSQAHWIGAVQAAVGLPPPRRLRG